MTDNQLKIIVLARDLASGVLKGVSGQVKTMSGNVKQYLGAATEASNTFGLAIGAVGAGIGYGLVTYGDQVQSLNNKLISVTGSQEGANAMFAELSEVAIRSRSDFDGIVKSFQKFELTNQSLGKPTKDTIKLVETLAKGLQYSGASATEAASAQLQLAQAYASGRLQGDEFRSLSESFPLLMFSIQESLGVTTAELKEMGSEGKITRDVIENAMSLLADDVEKHLGNMPVTIGQAFSIGKTIAITALQEINQKTKIFDKIGTLILDLGLRFQEAVPSIIAFIESFDQKKLSILAGVIAGALVPAIAAMGFAIGRVMFTLGPFMLAGALIVQYWGPIKEFLAGVGLDFDNLGGIIDGFKNFVLQIFATLGFEFSSFSEASHFMKTKVLEAWNLISVRITAVVNFFKSDILPIISEFLDTIQVLVGVFAEAWSQNWYGIKDILSTVWEIIKVYVQTAWEVVKNIVLFGMNILKGDWSAAWGNIKNILSAVWEGITNLLSLGFTLLKQIFSGGLQLISDVWNGVWSGLGSVVTGVFDGVMGTIRRAVDWIVGKIEGLLSTLRGAKKEAGSLSSGSASSAGAGLSQAVMSAYESSRVVAHANGGVGNFGFGAGITNGPVVGLAGEAGPEAIVPLPDGRSIPVIMKNPRQSGGGGNNVNVNIHVSGSVTTERDLITAVSEGFTNAMSTGYQVHS